jgi:tetratricopeptide (TPR) repeat protein
MGLEVTDRAVSANLRPLDGLKSGTFFLAMALLVFAPPFAPYAALFAQDAEEPAEEAAPAEEEAAPAEEAPAQEPGTAADAGGSSADVQSLLEEGLKLYQEGNYSGAAEKFERAFALNPSREDILRFVDKAGVASIFAMVRNPDPKIAGIALQVLQLTHTGAKAKSENEAEIAAAVRSVLAAKGQDQMVLMLRHTGTHGKNLVPALVPHLGDSDLSRRGAAINWIPKIGLDAVPILQAARKHPNPIVRRNIAYLLGRGHLRHHVSLGTLKAMMETDEAGEVKAAAEQSFETIIGELDGRGAVREAKEYFTANGGEYYLRPHRNPFANSFYTPKVYTLVGQRSRWRSSSSANAWRSRRWRRPWSWTRLSCRRASSACATTARRLSSTTSIRSTTRRMTPIPS